MDRGAWWATVHGVAKSWIQLSDKHFHFSPRIQQEYKVRGFSKSGIGLQQVWNRASTCVIPRGHVLCSSTVENSWPRIC